MRGLSQLSYYYQLADRPPIEVEMSISRDEALSYMVRQVAVAAVGNRDSEERARIRRPSD